MQDEVEDAVAAVDPDPAEARWLDEEERAAWLDLVFLTNLLPAALDAQLQRDAGVTHFDYMVLSQLSEAPGRALRMSDLATGTSATLSRLSHVVAKLEGRGWVERSPSPTDRRATIATLTEDGWRKVVTTAPGHVEAVRTFVLDPLDREQVRQLRDACSAIVGRLDPDDRLRSLVADRRSPC
ncbi:MarR family winged helix-turn-helix transcriptional regulator [Solicola sp. PLA-1-18]|uniref:MarR family winged helix-turn-helix transcriptional regulator n=1 Tax=Solicola sp. PLA-1-18 TaxID=3380532 RepID=UPI003B7DF22D